MTVYIEYVILDNFVFTLLICYLSFKFLREKVKMARCIIASTVGTVCAVIYPFIKGAMLVALFKGALYIVMCLILYLRMPKFIVRSAVFLLCTALLGGVQFMIGYIVFGNAEAALKYPVSELPLSLFFVTPLFLFFVIKKILAWVNTHRLKQNYIYDVRLIACGNSITIKGLIDTGNSVKAGASVVFINSVTAIELLKGEFIKVISGKESSSIAVHTAVGDKKIILFPAQIELYLSKDEHIFMDVQVGISDIKTCGEYQAILPLSILEKEKVL